jgi:hypothetical protein
LLSPALLASCFPLSRCIFYFVGFDLPN